MHDLGPVVEGLIGFFDRIITDQALANFESLTNTIGNLLPAIATSLDDPRQGARRRSSICWSSRPASSP